MNLECSGDRSKSGRDQRRRNARGHPECKYWRLERWIFTKKSDKFDVPVCGGIRIKIHSTAYDED